MKGNRRRIVAGSAGKQENVYPRFAVLAITEAPTAEEAKRLLEEDFRRGEACVWLSDACPVGPASTYELMELRLLEDEDSIVTGPGS
jgi:hypothetical protein